MFRHLLNLSALVSLLVFSPLMASDLDEILVQIDRVGSELEGMRAEIHQKKWTDILSEYDAGEKGIFAFLREDGKVYLKKEIMEPTENLLVIREGKVTFYQPSIKQAQEYQLGRHGNKAEFLLLGFGSDQQALKDTYEISLLGEEMLDGENTYKLSLKPRSKDVSAFFIEIVLWIDPDRWIPVQQKLVEPTRDHLLIRFADIELNPGLSPSDFKVELPKDVKVIGN